MKSIHVPEIEREYKAMEDPNYTPPDIIEEKYDGNQNRSTKTDEL